MNADPRNLKLNSFIGISMQFLRRDVGPKSCLTCRIDKVKFVFDNM